MKLIIDKGHVNSNGKKIQDGIFAKRFEKIDVNGAPTPGGDINELDPAKGIVFGGPWVTYTFKSTTPFSSQAAREDYEMFCCGYLTYYDDVTRNGAVDHGIYFAWEGSEKLSIYIYPSAKELVANRYTNFPRATDPQRNYKRDAIDDYLTPGPGGIDPQPPPPPPPPPVEI